MIDGENECDNLKATLRDMGQSIQKMQKDVARISKQIEGINNSGGWLTLKIFLLSVGFTCFITGVQSWRGNPIPWWSWWLAGAVAFVIAYCISVNAGKVHEEEYISDRAEDSEEVTLKTIRDEIRCQGTKIRHEQENSTRMSMAIAAGVALFVGGAVIGGETKTGLILMVLGGLLIIFFEVKLNRPRRKYRNS